MIYPSFNIDLHLNFLYWASTYDADNWTHIPPHTQLRFLGCIFYHMSEAEMNHSEQVVFCTPRQPAIVYI